ncbi:MAG: ChbG/HpnK family deacetylase [Patescibacteria group bacterium]
MSKYLIVNADDFGMSKKFNEAILELAEEGMLSSTTVLVDWIKDDQKDQIEKLKELAKNKKLTIGFHLEFSKDDYEAEIESQFEKFKSIFGMPSHVDIHKAHSRTGSFPFVAEFCRKYGFPLRNSGEIFDGIKTTSNEALFCSAHSFSEIENWVKTFKEGECYEAMFHPGKYDSNSKSSLNKEREIDVENVRKLNLILEENEIEKVSWSDLLWLKLEKG